MENVEVVAAATAMEGMKRRTNWATNIMYSTPVLHEVASVEEIQALVQSSQHVATAGTGHSFNFIADSLHARLSLRTHMQQVLHLDEAARTVTVEAGIMYTTLCTYLHRHGFALSNLASLTELSVAGAISTAAHGSGDRNRCLAAAIVAVELATSTGELIHLARHSHGDIFPGAVVGLGALGVMTKLTLQIEPSFTVRQFVYEDLPLQQVKENFDAIMSAGYTVSLFTDWQHQNFYQLWIKIRKGDPRFDPAPEFFFGAKRQTQNTNMVRGMDAIHCTEQMGVPGPWHDRLPHFRPGFMPGVGDELQSEYFMPRRHAVEAILAMERLRDLITPWLIESEIRTVAADDLWMSMCYRRDSVAIHFCWKNEWAAVQKVLPVIERELAPFDPRPHWGKLFAMAPAVVQGKYEKMQAFRSLAARLDPSAKFRNAFLNTYVVLDP